MTEQEALREIRKMLREHHTEVQRTALVIKAYALLIWITNHSRKL